MNLFQLNLNNIIYFYQNSLKLIYIHKNKIEKLLFEKLLFEKLYLKIIFCNYLFAGNNKESLKIYEDYTDYFLKKHLLFANINMRINILNAKYIT